MQDQVHLLGKLVVELGDNRLDRLDHIVTNKLGLRECLFGQSSHGLLNRALRLFGFRPEFLLQQRCKFAFLQLCDFTLWGLLLRFRHYLLLVFSDSFNQVQDAPLSSAGFLLAASVWSRAGSFRTFAINSSAPVLPSI